MTSPLNTFTGVQFAVDPGGTTRAEDQQWDGKTFWLPPEYLTAFGSGPGNPGVINGVRGYMQNAGPTGHQWVMISWQTPAVRTQFNAIPGVPGWRDIAARATYRNVATTLVETYAVPAPDVLTVLHNLYNAAVANSTAPPPGG